MGRPITKGGFVPRSRLLSPHHILSCWGAQGWHTGGDRSLGEGLMCAFLSPLPLDRSLVARPTTHAKGWLGLRPFPLVSPYVLPSFPTQIKHTVGAKSITRFLKKYVLLRLNISGHRHGRELCFFLFERSLPGKSYRGEDS
jgi:hypothetical protein